MAWTNPTTFNGAPIYSMPSQKLRTVDLTMSDTVSASTSPWTRARQTYDWMADWWEAAVSLPSLSTAQAGAWTAWLAQMRGQVGLTWLGHPLYAAPFGSAVGTPLVKGAGQSGRTLITDGWVAGTPSNPKNLVPDSDFDIRAQWQVNPLIPLVVGGGPNGSNAFVFQGTGVLTAAFTFVLGSAMAVTPGATYSFGCDVDVTAATGPVQINICKSDTGSFGTIIYPTPGTKGRYSGQFTIPVGVTEVYVILYIPAGVMVPLGKSVSFSSPQFEAGAASTPYTKNALDNNTGLLLPGDYFQIGVRLHMVTAPVNCDATGNATISFWPQIRESPADNAPINLSNPQGLFALSTNIRSFTSSEYRIFGVQFKLVEAL